MKIAQVSCLLRLTQKGDVNNLSVPRVGPDALLVTEIPILRRINDIEEGGAEDCCVSDVVQVDVVDTTRANEIERLKMKYGPQLVQLAYPGNRGLPSTLEECELPASAMGKSKRAPAKKPEAA